MSDPKPVQSWDLRLDGRRHRVEVHGSIRRRVTWSVDGVLTAQKTTSDDKIRLRAGEGVEDDAAATDADESAPREAVGVVFSTLGRPKRATLYGADEASALGSLSGLGGTDLDPEPGSRAAAYEEKVLAHPRRYAAIQTAAGVAKVVVPILLAVLAARIVISVPWPDLPSIPRPDLPSIPWPSIPWPDLDLPDWSLPGWVQWVLDRVKYVWPIVLAYVVARSEITRRRRQAELRAERARAAAGAEADGAEADEAGER